MSRNSTDKRAPLRWQGIVFAIAATVLLSTSASLIGSYFFTNVGLNPLVLIIAGALLAGVATARYVGPRGGTHAFIGGVSSIPLLAILIFADYSLGNPWGVAIFAGASAALGGLVTELLSRRRAS